MLVHNSSDLNGEQKFDCQLLAQALSSLTPIPDASAWLSVPVDSIHWFETVTSTNQVVWQLLQTHPASTAATVVIAGRQTAGRGQRGHQWQSPAGGLYLSIGWTPDLPASEAISLTLCSAWGIAEALRNQQLPVSIKWLNDLVVNGQKLGGILTETKLTQQRIRQAVIGVGLNWRNPVPPIGLNIQTLTADSPAAASLTLEKLAAITINGLIRGYVCYRREGIESLLHCYHSLLANLGEPIVVQFGSGQDVLRQDVAGQNIAGQNVAGQNVAGQNVAGQNIAGQNIAGHIVGVSAQGELRIQPETATSEIRVRPGELSLGYRDSDFDSEASC